MQDDNNIILSSLRRLYVYISYLEIMSKEASNPEEWRKFHGPMCP